MYLKVILPLILLFIFPTSQGLKKIVVENGLGNEWILSDILQSTDEDFQIKGNPQIITCKYGKAVLFNGKTDGIFLNAMPLADLSRFTVEAIVRPDSKGNFEQRFLHCGEVNGNRLLLEIRTTSTDWYFDAFLNSGGQNRTLIDENLLHPLDQWYHMAFVVDKGRQTTYINGKEELSSDLTYAPLHDGITSIGVRQNEVAWFNGAIYKIKFSPKALNPEDFMSY